MHSLYLCTNSNLHNVICYLHQGYKLFHELYISKKKHGGVLLKAITGSPARKDLALWRATTANKISKLLNLVPRAFSLAWAKRSWERVVNCLYLINSKPTSTFLGVVGEGGGGFVDRET